ncbi:MAG: hypothetical protein LAO56_18005 [Acidobacteriia bacterium]|nr:hypothetical protein [Terriglobia bacterium]
MTKKVSTSTKRKASRTAPATVAGPGYINKRIWKQVARTKGPLPDNPQARHEELKVDRKATDAAGPPANQAQLRQAAIDRLHRMNEAGTVTAQGAVDVTPPSAGASNWTPMGPLAIPNGQSYGGTRVLVTGRVTAIAIDPAAPNTVYVGTAQGGVWKSEDAGGSWRPLTDNEVSLAIGALALDPSNSQVIYAGTGEGNFSQDSYYGLGVLRSANGGATWTLQGDTVFAGVRIARIVVTPGTPNRIFAATNAGLYRSADGGATWTKLSSGLPASGACTDLVLDPTTPATVYAAFWAKGIYQTTNGGAATPSFTQLTSGLPTATTAAPNGFSRVSLAISPSSPQTVYALMSNNDTTSPPPGPPYSYAVDKLYRTTNGGSNWSAIALPGGAGTGIGGQGFYNLHITVDPTTPDIIYFGGIELWKGVLSAGTWTITKVGSNIHPDHHFAAVHPTNHLTLYAGNDGGVYRSTDGGATWDDSINKGLVITQYEFIDDHPSVDAVVIGGTQDNGTEQYRNSPVFYHADDGDGGFAIINDGNPTNVIATYYGPSPKLSTQSGKFGTWTGVWTGIVGTANLFYPPVVACGTDPNRVAIGTDRVNLDSAQGTGGWPTKVMLPGITAPVSAISYVDANLLYVGTASGQIYKVTGPAWAAALISQAPLPGRFIWDVSPLPGSPNTLIVVMSGFGGGHVWRGAVPASGAATWTDISGTGGGQLPDIPVNALVIDPLAATTMYIGTDVGVFRTTDGGTTWAPFSDGLPNCAVFDLRLYQPGRLLRAALHGRGLWEKKLDVLSTPGVDLFVRDHLMDSARVFPTPSNIPSAVEDPLQYVALNSPQWWWMCVDAKIDALEGTPLSYQMAVAAVDYVAFEAKLQHRQPQRGRVNRVYVQVHNRGYQPAANVRVKVMYADASAGLPPLPGDFWTNFPGDPSSTAVWHPIGSAQTIPSVEPLKPSIVEWDWTPPATTAEHSCLLVVIDCAADPIPAANKVFDIGQLVTMEKRVGLKNLHVIDAVPGMPFAGLLQWLAADRKAQSLRIILHGPLSPMVSLVFPKKTLTSKTQVTGLKKTVLSQTWVRQLKERFGEQLKNFDLTAMYTLAEKTGAAITGLTGKSGALLMLMPSPQRRTPDAFSVIQVEGERIVGGSTYVFRARKG